MSVDQHGSKTAGSVLRSGTYVVEVPRRRGQTDLALDRFPAEQLADHAPEAIGFASLDRGGCLQEFNVHGPTRNAALLVRRFSIHGDVGRSTGITTVIHAGKSVTVENYKWEAVGHGGFPQAVRFGDCCANVARRNVARRERSCQLRMHHPRECNEGVSHRARSCRRSDPPTMHERGKLQVRWCRSVRYISISPGAGAPLPTWGREDGTSHGGSDPDRRRVAIAIAADGSCGQHHSRSSIDESMNQ